LNKLHINSAVTTLNQWRKKRSVRTGFAIGLFVLGPILVLITYLALSSFNLHSTSVALRLIVLADLIYVLVVTAAVSQRIFSIISARRAQSAGSRLHSRLSAVFAFVALLPTVLVAIFATITLNIGLEGWFSERVRDVVGASLSAAEAYEAEQRNDLISDLRLMSNFLNQQQRGGNRILDADLVQLLGQVQPLVQRGLKEAYVIDGAGNIEARGDRSYLFGYEQPSIESIAESHNNPMIFQDWTNNEFRALMPLDAYVNRYLYISRAVDGDILGLLDDTKETVAVYNQMESERGRVLFELALLYLGFAVIVIMSAIWIGLVFAERLARPVGRLAGAVQRVGAGDLTVRVREEQGDDEIAMLGRVFNRMTKQVKKQRDDLIEAHEQTESRRRLFDSVLSGVTAGVIGLNRNGEVEVVNAAAARLLNLDLADAIGQPLEDLVPEFLHLFRQVELKSNVAQQQEVNLKRAGSAEVLLVRIASRVNADNVLEGYVVTFDDVTDLVSAQRMAAWGDVARRIAHEIKNPLTPIQLSAERVRRKFSPMLGGSAAELAEYTDVIIRQTNDLRRIVDEFSKFARMPQPELKKCDLTLLVKDAILLQKTAMEETKFTLTGTKAPIVGEFDETMIMQALTNLVKNAGEATESYASAHPEQKYEPEIRVVVEHSDGTTRIRIQDNGIGLPEQHRSRLFEPYVTHRESGTGLGLSIVKKIVEEHGGTLELHDAPKFGRAGHVGAEACITLPNTSIEQATPEKVAAS
jgi:two-component system nitrogen regulation sensor histidine kinase NtrY